MNKALALLANPFSSASFVIANKVSPLPPPPFERQIKWLITPMKPVTSIKLSNKYL